VRVQVPGWLVVTIMFDLSPDAVVVVMIELLPQPGVSSRIRPGLSPRCRPTRNTMEVSSVWSWLASGIPVVAMAGARLILNTGSPVSFARTGSITLGGCEHQVPADCWAGGPDSLSELPGAPVDGLLGCDLLAGRILDLDCPAGRAHVISRDTSPATPCWLANAIALSFSTTKRVPVAQLSVNGQRVAAAVDTGAAAFFAAPSLLADRPVIGRHHNFHAAIGRFETDLHLVSIGLAGGASPVDVAVAAAPSALAPLLARLELQAILGGDLLMGSETLFDFRAESGVALLSSPPLHGAFSR
jgi:hypothetical protein